MKTRRPLLAALFLPLMVAGALAMSACTPGAIGGETAVAAARTQIGQPYVYGGESRAEGGFDCSGLTIYAWQQAGVRGMPRTSTAQYSWTTKITRDELQAGDLVFYSSAGPRGRVSHVALYTGHGTIIQARRPGVNVGEVNLASYWTSNLVGYGRVPASALPAA